MGLPNVGTVGVVVVVAGLPNVGVVDGGLVVGLPNVGVVVGGFVVPPNRGFAPVAGVLAVVVVVVVPGKVGVPVLNKPPVIPVVAVVVDVVVGAVVAPPPPNMEPVPAVVLAGGVVVLLPNNPPPGVPNTVLAGSVAGVVAVVAGFPNMVLLVVGVDPPKEGVLVIPLVVVFVGGVMPNPLAGSLPAFPPNIPPPDAGVVDVAVGCKGFAPDVAPPKNALVGAVVVVVDFPNIPPPRLGVVLLALLPNKPPVGVVVPAMPVGLLEVFELLKRLVLLSFDVKFIGNFYKLRTIYNSVHLRLKL